MVTGKTALSRTVYWLLLALLLAVDLDIMVHVHLVLLCVRCVFMVKNKKPPMWAVAIFLIILRQCGKQSCPRLEVVALLCLFADRYENHFYFLSDF
jgi:hypothetical protein